MIQKFSSFSGLPFSRDDCRLYFKPHPLLIPYIAHYTVTFPIEAPVPPTLTLIPDASGCLVFTLTENQVEGLVWGATSSITVVPNDVNQVPMRLFVEFLPGTARHFLCCSPQEIANRQFSLTDADAELMTAVTEMLECAQDLPHLFDLLDEFFLRRFASQKSASLEISSLLLSGDHNLTVHSLSDLTGYSPRHLSRLTSQQLGLSLKTCLRLKRINQVLHLLEHAQLSLTHIAQQAGYYDQSHFIHDFQAVCGVTPSSYLKSLSDFYKEPFKF